MPNTSRYITVFEHQILKQGQKIDGITFKSSILEAMQVYHGEKGVPYYSLIDKGVKFNSFVGVIQVGNTTIEVLPKADKNEDKSQWRNVLIGMLQAVGLFTIHAPSTSSLHTKSNSILDLYFELFVYEVEGLLHKGLVKQCRKTEGQQKSLKGALQFNKHIQYNLIHKERFYVNHTVYDKEHALHKILYKALLLLKKINTNNMLGSRIGNLLLDFPEMPHVKITESLFDKLSYNRKTENYRHAIEIARLLLLNYHPDLSKGRKDVLALMFDMNLLWEQFVYASIRRFKVEGLTITAQTSKYFWKPDKGNRSTIRPDIVINKGREDCVVLDTKWKNLKGTNPSPDDLRQMFVYHKYYKALKVALVYPGANNSVITGKYYNELDSHLSDMECSLIALPCSKDIREWQKSIFDSIWEWVNQYSQPPIGRNL